MSAPKNIVSWLILSSFSFVAAGQSDTGSFSFLTGSCFFLDRSLEDSTGVLYKGDTSIFYSMSLVPADFMLWLGDNWYLSPEECKTPEGLAGKARYNREANMMRRLLETGIPEYAIWDDHDYGPDQSDKDFELKEESRRVFRETWKGNPSFGENGAGIYTSFRRGNVLFILLDDRWRRSRDNMWDRGLFGPNRRKRMFGRKQLEWLRNRLLEDSSAEFKIIVNGSQVLNPLAKGDCLIHFPAEYRKILGFISEHRINGVLFLSGDRHRSEIIRLDREGHYPLYDVTVSPFTSDIDPARGREKENPFRVAGSLIETYNFAHISFNGAGKQLTTSFYDKSGKLLFTWELKAAELKDH